MANQLKLFEASPLWSLVDDTLISFDLSFTRGLQLCGIDPTAAMDEQLESLSKGLAEVLSRVPAGVTAKFHCLQHDDAGAVIRAYTDRLKSTRHKVGVALAEAKAQQLRAPGLTCRRELYCFVSTPPILSFDAYDARLLGRRAAAMGARARALHDDSAHQVAALARTMAGALQGCGIHSQPLEGAELLAVLWRMANPGASGSRAPAAFDPRSTLRAQLLSSSLYNDFDTFVRDGAWHRVVTLRRPPRSVVPTQIYDFLALPFPFQLAVTLRRVCDTRAQARIEQARGRTLATATMLAKLRGQARDAAMPDATLACAQADAMDAGVRLHDGDKLFDVALHVAFSAPSRALLDQRTEQALAQFRACGQAEGAVEALRGRTAFLGGLVPGHQALIEDRYHAMFASRAADLLPVFQGWEGSRKPIALLSTRHGEAFGFNPFDTVAMNISSSNAVVVASSGSGKSFATRLLLQAWMAQGGRTIVVTRGSDYHRSATLLGRAKVVDLRAHDPDLALNPLPTYASLQGHAAREERLDHLTSIFSMMVTPAGEPPDRLVKHALFSAMKAMYAPGADVAWEPTISDLGSAITRRAERSTKDGERRLLERIEAQLAFWCQGPLGAALHRRAPNWQKPTAQVWNLEATHDSENLSVILTLLSGCIAEAIESGPTIVVLDECWSVLKSASGADLVEALYRTVRRAGSAVWTVSQSIDDYRDMSPAGRAAVLNNSPIKLFLRHDASELQHVGELFQLTAREQALLAGLKAVPGRYSDMLASFGGRKALLRVTPTPLEYWLATSHPQDVWAEARLRSEHPALSLLAGLQKLAEAHPHGAF